jgi:two-component system, NtrC family, sensor kinase
VRKDDGLLESDAQGLPGPPSEREALVKGAGFALRRAVRPALLRRGLGLRPLILIWLLALLALAFVVMFGLLVSLSTRALSETRAEDAKAMGRLLASQVARELSDDVRGQPKLARSLERHSVDGGALGMQVVDGAGRPVGRYGVVGPAPVAAAQGIETVSHPSAETLEITLPVAALSSGDVQSRARFDNWTVSVRMPVRAPEAKTRALMQTFALCMLLLAIGLLVFAYIALTFTVARPVGVLGRAAERVISGARELEVPERGGRELLELGDSLQTMTHLFRDNEQALQAKVTELEQATRKLRETRTQLAGSERLASVGRLAAGVAHEIGNPITAIMGLQDLLIEGGLGPETDRDFLGRMRKETERVNVIVRDLLTFARAERESSIGEPGNVQEAAEAVASLVLPQKEMKHIALTLDIEKDLPALGMSTSQLTQVLLNLVLNAKDALSVEPAPDDAAIEIKAEKAGKMLQIAVTDSGQGMPPSVQARAFEPFYTTKEVGAGTGLGLAVCRGLVESSHGEITIEEGRAKGTRIVVLLPTFAHAVQLSSSGIAR